MSARTSLTIALDCSLAIFAPLVLHAFLPVLGKEFIVEQMLRQDREPMVNDVLGHVVNDVLVLINYLLIPRMGGYPSSAVLQCSLLRNKHTATFSVILYHSLSPKKCMGNGLAGLSGEGVVWHGFAHQVLLLFI